MTDNYFFKIGIENIISDESNHKESGLNFIFFTEEYYFDAMTLVTQHINVIYFLSMI